MDRLRTGHPVLDPIDRTTEESLRDRIDPDEMDRHLDALEGLERVSGSDDEWTASEYVVDQLEAYGVDATLHEYEAYVSVPEYASVTVTTPRRTSLDAITVSFGASTPVSGTHAAVVGVEQLDGVDDLDDLDGSTDRLDGTLLFASSMPRPSLVRRAEAAGAAGVICQSPADRRYEGIVTPVWGTPSRETVADVPDLPVVEVGHADGEWLRDRLDHGPVEATVETAVTTELATLPCPVGRLEGAGSDRYFLMGNHVDSWYEGMTDNATAVAATLEVARVLAARDEPLHRGIVFGFWSAHSTGRYAGSAWYADEHWLDLRENGVAYLHVDLLGLQGADGLWFQHMAELGAEHRDAMASATSLEFREPEGGFLGSTGRPARNSDQSFWGAGLSSLLSGARLAPGTEEGGPIGGGWWWHTPDDTRDKVDLDVLVEETRLYVTLASRLCGSPVLPHDFRATVADVRDALGEIETNADGAVRFDDARDELDALAEALESATAVIERRVTDEAIAAAAEDLQVALGNTLAPAVYMSVEEYGHEPAEPHELLPALRVAEELPGLTGRDRRFAETSLRRARTKLVHRLRQATREVDSFLASHG
jgi:hypothetical protein